MNLPLFINPAQAAILIRALQQYQGENESIMNGWTLDNANDIEQFTTLCTICGEVDHLLKLLWSLTNKNPNENL